MSLHQAAKDIRKTNVLTNFEKTYPQVHAWFHSNAFLDQFIDRNEVTLRAEYIDVPKGGDRLLAKVDTVHELPFRDEDGVVELEDIVNYLNMEGFRTSINPVRAQGDKVLNRLVIRL